MRVGVNLEHLLSTFLPSSHIQNDSPSGFVSAYVAVEKEGLIQEKPLIMGEAQNKNLKLDIEAEVKLVQERLNELNVKGVNQAAQRAAMKELGLER